MEKVINTPRDKLRGPEPRQACKASAGRIAPRRAMGEIQSVCSGSKDNDARMATHPANRVPGPIRAPGNASRSADRLPTPPPPGPPAAGPEKPVQLTAEKSVSFGHRYETHYTTAREGWGTREVVDVGYPALNSQHTASLSGFMSVPASPERPKASGSTTMPGHCHSPQKQVPQLASAQGSAPFALPPTDEPKLHSVPLSQSPTQVYPGPQVAIGVQRSGAHKRSKLHGKRQGVSLRWHKAVCQFAHKHELCSDVQRSGVCNHASHRRAPATAKEKSSNIQPSPTGAITNTSSHAP